MFTLNLKIKTRPIFWQWWQADMLESYEKSEKKNHSEKRALKRRKFYIIPIFNIQSRSRSHLKTFSALHKLNPESASGSSGNFWNIPLKVGSQMKTHWRVDGEAWNRKGNFLRETLWDSKLEFFFSSCCQLLLLFKFLFRLLTYSFPLKWSDLNFFVSLLPNFLNAKSLPLAHLLFHK